MKSPPINRNNEPEAMANDRSLPSRSDALPSSDIAQSLHPNVIQFPSPEYREFLRIRKNVLDVVRQDSPQKTSLVSDIVDALLDRDPHIPTDLLSTALAIFNVGKKVREIERRRTLYQNITKNLLEQIFDPQLEFKLTRKDILDAFHAFGIARDDVLNSQIEYIYVRVIQALSAGELRDLTYEQNLTRYVSIKIGEIKLSRQDWELNGR